MSMLILNLEKHFHSGPSSPVKSTSRTSPAKAPMFLRLASDSHSAGRLCTWSQIKDLEKSNFLPGQIGAPFFKNKMPSSYGPGASTVGFMSV